MFRKIVLFTVILSAGGVVCVRTQDGPPDDVIKVNTTLVSVPVIVSDRDGRYIPGLRKTDFTVLQDGNPQLIEFFAAVEEPLNVALLIDTSQSTRGVLGDIKSAAGKFIKLLLPNDKAMIVTFDYDTHLLSALTSDREQLKRAVSDAEIPEYFGTKLRDAVAETIRGQFEGVNGRKAIILLTDGKDAGSRVSNPELIYSLQESDVMVYTVFFKTGEIIPQFRPQMNRRGGNFPGRFPPGDRYPRYPDPRNDPFPPRQRDNPRRRERVERQNEIAIEFLEKLAGATAGRFYESESSKLKETFALIVDELRHQYRLGFYPSVEDSASATHSIRVKVSRPDIVVRARSSYRVSGR